MLESGILINLYEDEKIFLVIRRHWLAFLQSILVTLALLLVFAIGFFILESRISSPASALCLTNPLITDNLGKGALVIFSSIYLLSACAFFYISWLDYYLDIFVITNKRILKIEQLVLFGQNVSETSLQHVQDVSSRVRGIIYTILNVGTVYIETAGERENFTVGFIKDPGEVAAEILELQKEMWGDEGFKEDMTLERKNEKIEKMNTGDPLRKQEGLEETQRMEAKAQEEAKKALVIEETKKDPFMLLKKVLQVGMKKVMPETKPEILTKKEEIKEGVPAIDAPIDISVKEKETKVPEIQTKSEKPLSQNHYNDGRKVTPNGVIWQSEQEISEDVLNTLNEMDD